MSQAYAENSLGYRILSHQNRRTSSGSSPTRRFNHQSHAAPIIQRKKAAAVNPFAFPVPHWSSAESESCSKIKCNHSLAQLASLLFVAVLPRIAHALMMPAAPAAEVPILKDTCRMRGYGSSEPTVSRTINITVMISRTSRDGCNEIERISPVHALQPSI